MKEVARQFATGAATEHSYRPALQALLSSDDLLHHKAIIAALVETRRLMDELDALT